MFANMVKELKDAVLNIKDEQAFTALCLEIFQYQAKENLVYAAYLKALGTNTKAVKELWQIPFLPISFFKAHKVICKHAKPIQVFESSGTTGTQTSKHYVSDLDFYQVISQRIFERFYGKLGGFGILALLPSYLERNNSSLIYMVQHFINQSNKNSGFYLHDIDALIERLREGIEGKEKLLLIGVTFALLDLAEKYEIDLSSVIVMETGGMKGRREEMIREEVHEVLKSSFNLRKVHSEYGMTELLSQFYSDGEGLFKNPEWAKIITREVNDPFSKESNRETGIINVIDLANIDSCCFIETKDLGKLNSRNQYFEVKGRLDYSEVRGCNLLIV